MISPLVKRGIEITIARLERADASERLDLLKKIAMGNAGQWDLPSARANYRPMMPSISLFGIYATAEDLPDAPDAWMEELPVNWMRIARNFCEASA